MEYNKHTIWDANLPPSADDFAEEFMGCQLTSLVDFFSGYDQVLLDVKSRDLTAFHMPLGLLWQMTLPQCYEYFVPEDSDSLAESPDSTLSIKEALCTLDSRQSLLITM